MHFSSLLVAMPVVHLVVGVSLVLSVLHQPVLAQEITPENKPDIVASASPITMINAQIASSNLSVIPLPPPVKPPEVKPDPREPSPPQDIDLSYGEKDWTQPVDPKTTVDEDLRSPKIKKDISDEVTATLPITDASGLGKSIRVEIVLDSTRAVPGGEVLGNVYVGSGQAQKDIGLVMSLPKGLDYIVDSSPSSSFDPKTNELTWQFSLDETGLATFPFVLKVLSDVMHEALKLDVKAQGQDKRNYQIGKPAKLRVADANVSAELNSKGGKLDVDAGRVILEFGAGALKEPLTFVASVFKTDLSKKAELHDGTQGTAEDASPLTLEVNPSTEFETPITATINLAGLIPIDLLSKGLVPELRYAREGELDVEQTDAKGEKRTVKAKGVDYETIPGIWDPGAQTLTVWLTHFSTYSVGFTVPSGAPEPWKLNASLGDVSLYRGSMNWSLPIAMPGFPNGAPGLSIAYSSAAADSGAGREEFSDYRLGWGWDLNGVPVIQQGVKAEHKGSGSSTWYEVISDTLFRLSLGGHDYNLVYKSSVSGADEYVPEDYAPVRAVRCKTGQTCNGWELPASVVPTWPETTITGLYGNPLCASPTMYTPVIPSNQYYWQVWTADGTRYVFGTDAASTQHMQDRDGNGTNGKIYYQKWYLTRVADPVRDNPSQNKWSAEYSYVEDARSGDNGTANNTDCIGRGADWENRTRLTQVIYGNSQAAISRPYKVVMEYTVPYANWQRLNAITVQSNNTNLRRYAFGFSGYPWDARLSSITEQGWNGSIWVQLPATTFEYYSNSDYSETKYGKITAINNGYGGRVEHDYYWWTGPLYYQSYNTVLFRRLIDGLGNTTQERYDFQDGTQCYNDTASACYFGRDNLFPESRNKLMGFSTVWKTVSPVGGSALSTVNYSHLHNKRWLGKPSYIRVYNAAQTSVLSTQVNYYGLTEPAPGQPAGTWLTWLGRQDAFPLGNVSYNTNTTTPTTSAFVNRTETDVDGLGNPIEIREYGYFNLIGDERTTRMGYAPPNWSQWVLGKLGYENRHTGVAGQSTVVFRNQTILYYDGHANWNDTLTLGQLTQVGHGRSDLGGSQWAVQNMAYDGAGNLNQIVDARGFVSIAYYDDATLKPLWTKDPLGNNTYYRYFGRDGIGAVTGQPWGEYYYITDPNGQTVSWVQYDPYGRVIKVAQPGDTDVNPTQQYIYSDAGLSSVTAPLKIEARQRETAGCSSCYIQTLSFYDGLGRAVQTRAEAPSSKQRVANITYDALGRAVRQYAPALEATNPSYSRPTGWDTRPNTLNAYDMRGQTTSVTGPDGVATTIGYGNSGNMALTTVFNGLAVPKNSLSDGLGQLKQVYECHDADMTNGVQCSWQTTNYGYDAVYGLTSVTDAATPTANTTTMAYNALGRKVDMVDPDMGHWVYSYDANGNLTSQTDAKSPAQVLTFAYDPVNRMTDKFVDGTWTSWNRYDETGNGGVMIGRRSRMGIATWMGNNWSNETNFFYDARGRMTRELRAVDGVGIFDTQYAYDSADRVTSMTYPDNEVVTTAYDAAGQPLSLGGTNTYVSSASYNALGQATVFTLGNTLSQRWYYYGSNLSAPHTKPGTSNNNWNYGKLRQTCVLAASLGDCFDWTVRAGGSSNTQLNLYNNYDDVGNVTQVYDRGTNGTTNYDHAYTYDALDRLKSWNMTGSGSDSQSYSYNAIGNLTSKTGVGTMSYGSYPGWGCTAGPHAMVYATGGHGACYDANGNMTLRWAPGNSFIYGQTWNADNKLIQVKKFSADGNWTNLGTLMDFSYDADGNRVKTTASGINTAYVGNHYEVKDTPNTYVNVTFAKTVGVNMTSNTLTRNTGTNSWGGSGASSTAYCTSGYCAAYASAAATNTDSMYGLSNADPDASYTSIRYGLHLQSTGNVLIYESGVNKGTVGSYGAGDRFSVQAEGDNKVRYYRLPAGSGTWQLLYTSTDIPTYPLRMDSAIYSNGGQLVNVQMYGSALKTLTSYYYFGGQRVAMRTPTDGLQWLHADHLGSSSLTTSNAGSAVASARYKPFGEVRSTSGTMSTNRKFNGNLETSYGTISFPAREYSPLLGRFLSADSIVPRPGDPQSLNRYSFVRNNPMTRVDPDGHEDKTDQCGYAGVGCPQSYYQTLVNAYSPYIQQAGISFLNTVAGTWKASEMIEVIYGAVLLGLKVGGVDHLRELLGGPTVFQRVNNVRIAGLGGQGSTTGFTSLGVIHLPSLSRVITVFDAWFESGDTTPASTAVHELAHVIDFNNPQPGEIKEGIFKRSNRYSDIFPAVDPITYYGKNGPLENFAEAVTDWVFGASYRPGTPSESRNPLTTNQSEWLDKHLGGGP